MFKAVLSDVDLLKGTIPIIAEIVDEGVFRVDQNGISLLSPDRAMVAVVNLKILSTAFDEYNATGEDYMGLNLANFSAVLKRLGTGDKLVMELTEGDNKLKLTIKGNGVRTFEIPILDIKTEKPPIDKLNFTGKMEVEANLIEQGISDAEIIGDSVFFEADGETFRMYARGDVSSAQMEVKKSDKGVLDLKAEGSIKSQYPLEYLRKMIKAGKISQQMTLEFGTDYPVRMGFKSVDKMEISFVLAPRVES
ncbi:proliferating cell nuclear antigen (pcna) [Candidatus Aenigmatarchaeota archaeon]